MTPSDENTTPDPVETDDPQPQPVTTTVAAHDAHAAVHPGAPPAAATGDGPDDTAGHPAGDAASRPTMTLTVDHGALTDAPVWESHARGTNWAATITAIDPAKPGGLDRAFWQRARGDFLYLLPERGVRVGDALEFAGDYTTASGNRSPNRWYGVVTEIGTATLVLAGYDTARAAYEAGQELLSRRIDGQPDAVDTSVELALAELNAALTEPGRCWYVRRGPVPDAPTLPGELDRIEFVLLTDDAAREAGLLEDSRT